MFKTNKSKNVTNQEDAFTSKDFNASAKVTTYTATYIDNGSRLTRSVPFGTRTSLLTERISASFFPTSGISSINMFSPHLTGDTTYFGVISSNKTFPLTLLNNGSGKSQVVTIGSIYDNTRLHTTDESEIARFEFSVNNPKLYAAAARNGDTMTPTGTVLRSSSYRTLTAKGGSVVYTFTPQFTALNARVAYGTRSSALVGTATFATSSLAGNTTGLSAIDFNVYLSGGNTTKFSRISASVSLPANNFELGLVRFSTTYDNTYLHSATQLRTVNVVVSCANPSLSAGWTGAYSTGRIFTAGVYTLTAVGDAASPGVVTGFRTNRYIDKLKLSWTDPVDLDLSAVQIKYSTTGAISSRAQGTLLANVAAGGESTWHTSLSGNTVYYYGAFTQDNVGKWNATVVRASGVPITNNTNGAFAWETEQQTLSRFSEEGLI